MHTSHTNICPQSTEWMFQELVRTWGCLHPCRSSGVSSQHMTAVTVIVTRNRRETSTARGTSRYWLCTATCTDQIGRRSGQRTAKGSYPSVKLCAALAGDCLQLPHWRFALAQGAEEVKYRVWPEAHREPKWNSELSHRLPCETITKWALGSLTLDPALLKTDADLTVHIRRALQLHWSTQPPTAETGALSRVYALHFCTHQKAAGSAMISPRKSWDTAGKGIDLHLAQGYVP